MPSTLPNFSLTHGQVAWTIARGQAPEQRLLDQLRYLRALGVPFKESELGTGRGNRLRYRYDHLIEVGVGVFGLGRGMKPLDIATFLIKKRTSLRRAYRQVYLEEPEGALDAPWVKSRGRLIPFLGHEYFMRLHDRHSIPGTVTLLDSATATAHDQLFGVAELYPGEQARMLLPLTRLVLELVAWAREAPETRTGPQ